MTGAVPRAGVVLAAVDCTPAVHGVLDSALALGVLLGTDVESLYVHTGGYASRLAARASYAAAVPFRQVQGNPPDRILEALEDPTVLGLVIGTRSLRGGPIPAGAVARAVLAASTKPLVLVPPEGRLETVPRRFLVPLDGSRSTSRAFLAWERRLHPDPEREIDVLVAFDGMAPSFLDHAASDPSGWGHDFMARNCPGPCRYFHWQIGAAAGAVVETARRSGSDLIVLSFTGSIEMGHGTVVREVLARSPIPVAVLPPGEERRAGADLTDGPRRRSRGQRAVPVAAGSPREGGRHRRHPPVGTGV